MTDYLRPKARAPKRSRNMEEGIFRNPPEYTAYGGFTSAQDFDSLIRTLQQTLGLTVFMVTHDLDSLHTVCNRIAVLADGKVVAEGPMSAMLASEHTWVKSYFRGKRGRALRAASN